MPPADGSSVNGADGRRGPGSSARAAGVVGVLGVGVVSICIVWLAMPSASTRYHVTDVRLDAPFGRAATTTLAPAADVLPTEVTGAATPPSTSHKSSRNQTYLAAPPAGAAPSGAPLQAVTVPAASQQGLTATQDAPSTVVLSTLGDLPTTTANSTTTAKPTPTTVEATTTTKPKSTTTTLKATTTTVKTTTTTFATTTTGHHHPTTTAPTTTAPTTTAPTTTAPTTSATVTLPTTVIGTVAPPTQDAPPSQEITQ